MIATRKRKYDETLQLWHEEGENGECLPGDGTVLTRGRGNAEDADCFDACPRLTRDIQDPPSRRGVCIWTHETHSGGYRGYSVSTGADCNRRARQEVEG